MTAPAPVELTPAAAARLRELLAADPARAVVRLYVAGRTCCSYRYGMAFDAGPHEGDLVSEVHGVRLVVDPASSEGCTGASIDYVESDSEAGFAVNGPVGDGCACGRARRQ